MDEEQVKALIAGALEDHGKTLLTQIDQKNAGLAASLTKELKKSLESLQTSKDSPTEPGEPGKTGAGDSDLNSGGTNSEGKLTLKALQSQLQEQTKLIQQLKEEGDRKEQAAFTAKRKAALSSEIAGAKTLNPTLLQKVLELEYGEAVKEEGGAWYVQRGETVSTLKDAIATYLQTDEGKAFLPPSGTQGAGSTESKTPAATTESGSSTTDALMAAF